MRACSYQPHQPAIRVVLRELSSRGNGSSERTPRKTPTDCYLRAAAWQRTHETEAVQVTKSNDRPDLSPEGALDIDKTVTVTQ
jgi:hypothetical protein